MVDDINDAVLPILVKIQEEAAAFRKEVRDRFDAVDKRFDGVDEKLRSQRRDIAGMLVMMKGAAGVFDERVTSLEHRMELLEQHKN